MNYHEERIQKGIVLYFHCQFPKLRGTLCSNLNNSKDGKTGGRNKALGVIAGRSDLVLYHNSKAYHIEVKQPTTYQSKPQKEWQAIMEGQGFDYFVVRSLDEFIELLEKLGFVNTKGIR